MLLRQKDTFRSSIKKLAALRNYLKLFTIMWFTWLSITLFDVRFRVDGVWSRLHKGI